MHNCQEDKAVALTIYLVFFTLFFFVTCIVIAFIKRRQERRFPPLSARTTTPDATAAPPEVTSGVGLEGATQRRMYSGPTYTSAALFHNVGVTSPVTIPPPYSSIAFDTSVLIVTSDMPPSYSEADDSRSRTE